MAINPYYKSFRSPVSCEECGTKLYSYCSTEYVELAYCSVCDIKYERDRIPIDMPYKVRDKPRTALEDNNAYYCIFCEGIHAVTKPNGDFSKSVMEIPDREALYVSCTCGSNISVSSFGVTECENCGRKVELSPVYTDC